MTSATEQRVPNLQGFDAWESDRILDTLLAGQYRALDAVKRALPAIAAAAEEGARRVARGGKLFYAGAGTSIRVAVQDGSELPATFGFDESRIGYLIAGGERAIFETMADAEDNVEEGTMAGNICGPDDILIAVAASGRTPYTIAAAKAARTKGCHVVAVVNNAGSALAASAHVEVLLGSGPEVISGSTRMGAGTAQKAALNLFSTLLNTRLGAVHDGLMVNVQSGNSKLRHRAAGIVAEIAGVEFAQAEAAMQRANNSVKLAVLLCKGAASLPDAHGLLTGSNGNLRVALAKLANPV